MSLDLPVVHGDDGTWGDKLNAALRYLDTTVTHGSAAATARPASALPVLWIGTVAPTNALARDLWLDETGPSLKRTADGAAWVSTGGGSSVASLTPTAVKTSAYTAAASDYVPVDTTSGSVTVTLPAAPADKTQIGVKHVVRGGTNVVTIACGGSDVLNKTGGSTTGTLTLLNQSSVLQYKASTGVWYVVGGDLPLSQLDTRYQAAGSSSSVAYPSGTTATIVPRPTIIDARDYGVAADNSTDDTAALQAAIDAASTPALYSLTGNNNHANEVQLPRGRMVISYPGLKLNANVVLRGHGPANTYLIYNGSGGTANTDVVPGGGNAAVKLKTGAEVQCEVRDLGIICNRSTSGTGDDGIDFTQTGGASILGDTRHVIENVIIVGGRYQIVLNSGSECRLRNVGCYRGGSGAYGTLWIAGTDHFIEGVTVAQPGKGGFRMQTSNTRMVNCKAFGGGDGSGTALSDTGQRNQFIGCEIQDYNGTGLSIGESTVIGGLVDSCSGQALALVGGNASGSATVRGLRILNRPGGSWTLTGAIYMFDNTNADVDVRVSSSGGGTTALAALMGQNGMTGSGNRLRVNGAPHGSVTQAAYAATYTPDPLAATRHYLATATGNVTIANPVSLIATNRFAHVGMELDFQLPVDATGGYTLAFGNAYKLAGSAPAMAASSVVSIRFRYDGTNWREIGRSIT